MLNLNAMKIIAGCMAVSEVNITGANGSGDLPVKTSGNTSMVNVFSGMNVVPHRSYASSFSASSTGLYFGATAHPATVNDFNFADTSDLLLLTGSGTTPVIEVFDDHIDIYTALSLKNEQSEDAVISEIYYAKWWYNSMGYLLDHTVLDTPITVPANGGTRNITYTIRINF